MVKAYIISFIFLLAYFPSAKAVDENSSADKKLHQYKIEYWNSHKGLPYNSLLNIYQSKNGYLWISGYQGLIRFDGHKFVTFNRSNTTIFRSNIIGDITEDNLGNLWFTTQESGLIKYNNGIFESFGTDLNLKHLNRALLADDIGRIWSSSPENGWFYFENNAFRFLKHKLPLKNIEVRDIIQTHNGNIVFATLGSGLFVYDGNNLTQYNTSNGLPSDWIYALYVDVNNRLWVGSSDGLYYMQDHTFISIKTLKNIHVKAITQNSSKHLWIGTNNGLYRLNTSTLNTECLDKNNGLTNSFINDLTFDFEGNLWITHNKGGLTQISDGKFVNYSSNSGLNSKIVNAVCEYNQGEYILGYDNGMVDLIKEGKVQTINLDNRLAGKRIRDIRKDSKNNLWISTYGGLLKIDNNTNSKWYTPETGLAADKIRLTFEDSKGNIWIGTRNNGAFKLLPNGDLLNFSPENGLSSFLIMSISEDNKGDIYIGTNEGGLNIIRNNKVITQLNKANGFQSDIVFNSYHDSEGDTWVALNGGLCFIHEGNIHCFTTDDGLLVNSPFDIIESEDQNFWFPSPIGVMMINKQSILSYIQNKTEKINCRLYNHNDGMYENECNATARAIKTSEGVIIFPTIDGITLLNPKQTKKQAYIPPVYIEQVLVDNISVDKNEVIKYQSGNKRITIKYSAISFSESERIKFKYQLVGYENNWQDAQFERSVSYTNLSPGSYTFKVIASNSNGEWNETGDEIQIFIKPRFFERNSFYVLSILFLVLLSYMFYIIRIRQLKKSKKDLEVIIQKRTKELFEKNEKLQAQKNKIEDKNKELTLSKAEIEKQAQTLQQQSYDLEKLNESKDRMFTIIAHDLRSPVGNFKHMLENLIAFPERYDSERRDKIMNLLTKTAESTFDLLENLLNWSKTQMNSISFEPEIILLSTVLDETLNITQPLANEKDITITSHIKEDVSVYADINMVRTVFRNLITNAIKFTHKAGQITINAEPYGDYFMIKVKDNGIGIKEESINQLFNPNEPITTLGTLNEKGSGLGLTICRDFVKRNGGKIWVESNFGKGSEFMFTLKKAPF